MLSLQSMFSLEGKTALVTGGSRGCGAMMAEGLVAAGARVFISARSAEACAATAESFGDYPGECTALPGDLASLEKIDALVADLAEYTDKLDILINNAGTTWGEPFAKFQEKGWDSVLNLNAKAPFFLIQKLLPMLKSAGTADDPARVINISSVQGSRPDAMLGYSYSASKGLLNLVTKNLAHDLIKYHINVNAIAPGIFPSKMTEPLLSSSKLNDQFVRIIPMGRLGGLQDLAAVCVYMCAKGSAYMAGEIVHVDGGMMLSCS